MSTKPFFYKKIQYQAMKSEKKRKENKDVNPR
jgi:hypothetical protein